MAGFRIRSWHCYEACTADRPAIRAREIYRVIFADDRDAALNAYKKSAKRACPLTVGECRDVAQKYLDVRPRTFGGYARALRKIVSDLGGLSESSTRDSTTRAAVARSG
jgi:hypothetical protein